MNPNGVNPNGVKPNGAKENGVNENEVMVADAADVTPCPFAFIAATWK